MKKKIGDLTEEELKRICQKQKNCLSCPFDIPNSSKCYCAIRDEEVEIEEMRRDIRDLYLSMQSIEVDANNICKLVKSLYANINSIKAQLEAGVLSSIDDDSKDYIKTCLDELENDVSEIEDIVL